MYIFYLEWRLLSIGFSFIFLADYKLSNVVYEKSGYEDKILISENL